MKSGDNIFAQAIGGTEESVGQPGTKECQTQEQWLRG